MASGKWVSDRSFQDLGVVDGGVAVGDLDVAPSFQRREHHEEVGHPVSFIFVVVSGRAARRHGDRRAGLGDQLFRCFVQADQRMVGIVRPLVDGQHIFHSRYERAVGFGRNDPALFAVGLDNVFF